MDVIDVAQHNQIRDTEIALQERLRYRENKVLTGFCEECGAVIPQARVLAVNATTCISCALEIEAEEKRWR
jgi:RNA polymerase-binding transcription factor DksA